MTKSEYPENKIIGFFINQRAGLKRDINYKDIIKSAQRAFYELNYEVIIFDEIYLDEVGEVDLLRYDSDIKEILKYSDTKKAELILCAVGGDGTFNLLVNRTIAHLIPGLFIKFAFWGIGTVNVFSLEFNLPNKIEGVLKLIQDNKVRSFQLWDFEFINDSDEQKIWYCLMFSSIGIDAEALENVNIKRKRQFGKKAIVIQGFKDLVCTVLYDDRNKRKIKIHCFDEIIFANWVVFSNISYYAGKFKLFKISDPSDQLFEVIIQLESPGLFFLTGYLGFWILMVISLLFRLKQVPLSILKSLRLFRTMQVEKIQIQSVHEIQLQIDGDAIGRCSELRIKPGPQIQILI